MAGTNKGNSADELMARLGHRRGEVEQAAFDRIAGIANPAAVPDPSYVDGLRSALVAALDYAFSAFGNPRAEIEPVPVQLLAQARLAARNGVPLEAVLRRYAAGHSLLVEAILDESAALGIPLTELKVPLRALAQRYDRIVAAVGEEHAREVAPEPGNADWRRRDLVRRLLAGEPLESTEIDYDLGGHHLAFVGWGEEAREAFVTLRQRLDRRLLLVSPDEDVHWAWLGGRRSFEREELDQIVRHSWPTEGTVACGAPGHGLTGWRLSHRQACAALSIARRRRRPFTRYVDVALCAAILRDEALVAYLTDAFLAPLTAERGGGETLRKTLRAYFATGCNVSSAASILDVNRQTVTSRLRAVERRLGLVLDSCRAEMEAALEIADLVSG